MNPFYSTFVLALALLSPLASAQEAKPWPPAKPSSHDYKKWEKTMQGFAAADKKSPPPKGAVLFVGSSTIVKWTSLAKDFPEVTVINRGFGGNQTKDCTYYAEQTIFPYEPKVIVLRGGSNDINAGWPVEDVMADFKSFVTKVRTRYPDVPIALIGLFPTIKREQQIPTTNRLNDLLIDYCANTPGLTYIETRTATLGPDGKPVKEYFAKDMLHLSERGYEKLTACVKPVVLKLAGVQAR